MIFGIRIVHILLILLAASVFASATSNLIDSIDHFIANILAGIQLTGMYIFTLGQSYPPIDQDVTFWCIMPEQTDLKQTFFNDPDIKSKIDFTKPVNFLIHGWMGGMHGGFFRPNKGWMPSTAVTWAKTKIGNCNVCAVDWSRLANCDYSIAAMRHTKMVSDALEFFMHFLIDNGMEITQVSIAGHSLGAQIAGFIGEKFGGKIDAIYGLDPAGPGFTWPFDLGRRTRLDKSDAKYVQCVHTTRGTLGTKKDCGHADFIMNGGFIQPGCYSVICSHSMAPRFFESSLDPSNEFIGEQCSGSFKLFLERTFLRKTCTGITDRLGIHSARTPGRFFINTK